VLFSIIPFHPSPWRFSDIMSGERLREARVRPKIIGLVPFAAFLAACSFKVSFTSGSPQWRLCTGNPGVEWDQQIEACTALIQSGKETRFGCEELICNCDQIE
jgi:hypothetical protein